MPLQRYDAVGPEAKFRGCYWKAGNWPALDDAGSVIALVHHVVEVPTPGRLSRYFEEARQTAQVVLEQQRQSLDRAEGLALERAELERWFGDPKRVLSSTQDGSSTKPSGTVVSFSASSFIRRW
jgi:hypothetical protein